MGRMNIERLTIGDPTGQPQGTTALLHGRARDAKAQIATHEEPRLFGEEGHVSNRQVDRVERREAHAVLRPPVAPQ